MTLIRSAQGINLTEAEFRHLEKLTRKAYQKAFLGIDIIKTRSGRVYKVEDEIQAILKEIKEGSFGIDDLNDMTFKAWLSMFISMYAAV